MFKNKLLCYRNHEGKFLCSLKGTFRKCPLPLNPNVLEAFSSSTNTSISSLSWFSTHLGIFHEQICNSPGQIPWVGLSSASACTTTKVQLFLSPISLCNLTAARTTALLNMQQSPHCISMGGERRKQELNLKFRHFYGACPMWKDRGLSVSGESGVIFLVCLGCSHSYLNTMAQTLAFLLLIFLKDCSSLTPVTQFH